MRRLPSSVLLCAFFAAIIVVVAAKSPLALGALSLPALIAVLSKPAARGLLLRRLLLVLPLAAGAVALGFLGHAPSAMRWAPLLRMMGAVAWSTWLSAALSPRELERALRGLGVPAGLLELIAQTRRFSGQLAQTSSDAWNAALLRGGLLSTRASARTAGLVAGVIVARAFDRAENVAIAAALRGRTSVESAPARVGTGEVEGLA